jgi:hypothetical protein
MGKPWGARTTWDEVCRRNAGRKKYHAIRRFKRRLRQRQVLDLVSKYGLGHGTQSRISRDLGVSPATVCRDIKTLLESCTACPRCGSLVSRERIDGVKPVS